MADEKKRQLVVVMFPWLALGHMTPFLELARNLATHGLKIIYVSTPLNIKRLKPQVLDGSGVDFMELAMPSVEGLPKGVECSADVVKRADAPQILPLLSLALDLLEKPFEELLQKLSPDFVMYDVMQYWVPRVTAKLSKPIAPILFIPVGVTGVSFLEGRLAIASGNPNAEDLTVSPPGFPSPNIHLRLFEGRRATELMYRKRAGSLSIVERASICMRESRAIAFNSCSEIEGTYAEYLQSLVKRPLFPVGLLMPKLPRPPVDDICLQWLDRQPAASVVFLSFGSQCILTHAQLTTISMGLVESNASFLWLLPAGNDLPQGFQAQIEGIGGDKVGSTAAHFESSFYSCFFTHCGWNSITEGLRFGLPLITLPMQFEQGLNAKLIRELKFGVEVKINEDDGSFTKEDISKAIRILMTEGGEEIKSNVAMISDMLTSNNFQIAERNMRDFVSILRTFNK